MISLSHETKHIFLKDFSLQYSGSNNEWIFLVLIYNREKHAKNIPCAIINLTKITFEGIFFANYISQCSQSIPGIKYR